MTIIQFQPGERNAIDAAEDLVRELLAESVTAQKAGFPYVQHHRWARAEIRRGNSAAGRLVFEEIAALLLDWARHCGDVRLYAWQPFVCWAWDLEQSVTVRQLLIEQAKVVRAAPIDFISFAREAAKSVNRVQTPA